ncbi:MAG: hypothetical protein IJ449_03585 [Clostridia bacterium]|nr:hypothetical protein [Clostridia bacterium]
MKNDLTGQKFGLLTAMEPLRSEGRRGVIWRCVCDCGREKEVPAMYLRNGHTQSCGCMRRTRGAPRDISGQVFGRLTARSFQYYNEKKQDCWSFSCTCGKEIVIPAANVKWGNTRSCGCLLTEHMVAMRTENITGERFGSLVALSPTDRRDSCGSIVWKCQCDCGNTAFHSVSVLRHGHVRSCGCLYRSSRADCSSYRRDITDGTCLGSLIAAKNVRRNNSTGCTGVYQNARTGMYTAYINFRKKRYYLGSFENKDDAVRERRRAEQRLHDPMIEERFSCVTEEGREKFREYLEQKMNLPGAIEKQPAIMELQK